MNFLKTVNRQDCPKKTGAVVYSALKDYKLVHVSSDKEMPEGLNNYYLQVAKCIGELCPMEEDLNTENKTGDLFTHIVYDERFPNSYRHSNTRQPLHTDGAYEANAPNISFFYCLTRSPFGGSTTFINSDNLIHLMDVYKPSLLKSLRETPVTFYKGNDSKTKPIIDESGALTWNWHRCDKTELTQGFHDFLEKTIVGGRLTFALRLQEGEAVFFWDELMLHGRDAFLGHRHLIKGGLKYERPKDD